MTFSCKVCDSDFVYQYQLIIHQYSHAPSHDENKENESCRCDLCDLEFINLDHLMNHVAQHCKEQKFVCGQCKKSFKTENRYIHHITDRAIHLNGNKCSLCSKILSTKKYLQDHMKLHTRETQYSCKTCFKPFLTKKKLDIHEQTHSPGYRCSVCSKTFKSKLILIAHHRSVHNASAMFQCSHCTKKYLKLGHLKSHLSTHDATPSQEEKNKFQCNECGKTFRTSGNLMFHKRSHKK